MDLKEQRVVGLKISIIVGYYNEHQAIEKWFDHMLSIEEPGIEYEYIVVSDSEHSHAVDRPRTIQLFTERGYTKAFNAGIKHATGDFLVLSNADSLVQTEGWLRKMLDTQDKFGAALVGCTVHGYMTAPKDYKVDYGLPSFFWLMPSEKARLFDERYAESGGAYFDDYDYCYELFKAGETVAVCTSVSINHTSEGFMNRSSDRDQKRGINREVFKAKWGELPADAWLSKIL